MFNFDFAKLLVVGVMALIFIPPKDLPRVLRQLGQGYGKLQRLAADFRRQITEALEEADIDSVKREFTDLTDSTNFDFDAPAESASPEALPAPAESAPLTPELAAPAKMTKARQTKTGEAKTSKAKTNKAKTSKTEPKPDASAAAKPAKKPARAPRKAVRAAPETPEMVQIDRAAE
ncbi:MAG: hypothetical protein KGQ37_07945 [Hyphomicrobiales bacterium]|nr:hypothetical protein [Hyphomicrobiales bacterium]